MIFQPNYDSGAPSPGDNSFGASHESARDGSRGAGSLPSSNYPHNRLSNGPAKLSGFDNHPDNLTQQRFLRLAIAGVEHRGDDVLTDLTREFPALLFSPSQRHVEFREALLEAALPTTPPDHQPHPLIREERVHRLIGTALSNLVARATDRPIRELRLDDGEDRFVGQAERTSEYLASAWAVRSFIRLTAAQPEMFRILVTEMAQIQSSYGRFSLGVPMSPLLAYEFFNAAARNPDVASDVIQAFDIIGYKQSAARTLFSEFQALLNKQLATA